MADKRFNGLAATNNTYSASECAECLLSLLVDSPVPCVADIKEEGTVGCSPPHRRVKACADTTLAKRTRTEDQGEVEMWPA